MRLSHKIPPLHGAWPPYGPLRVLAWELNFHLAAPHHAWLPVGRPPSSPAPAQSWRRADEPQIGLRDRQDDDWCAAASITITRAPRVSPGLQPFQDREIRLGAPGLGDGGSTCTTRRRGLASSTILQMLGFHPGPWSIGSQRRKIAAGRRTVPHRCGNRFPPRSWAPVILGLFSSGMPSTLQHNEQSPHCLGPSVTARARVR